MELCLGLGFFAIIFGAILGTVAAIVDQDIAHLFAGFFVGAGIFLILALFGLTIGPIEEESITSPETRIEIVSPEGEVTFFDEGDFKIQEITDDFIKYEEDGEKITIYIEDGSKVKVIDLEE